MTDLKVVLVTCPAAEADALARRVVEARLAACCNRVRGVTSTYWWEGALTQDDEDLLVFKVPEGRLAAFMSRLAEWHPYDVPEILALPVEAGLPAYLEWARREAQA